MIRMHIKPDAESYQWSEPEETRVITRLASGRSRIRKDAENAHKVLQCTFSGDRSRYLYLTTFFESGVNQGVDEFEIDLITDHPTPEPHICRFLRGFGLVEQRGHFYRCSATFEVRPVEVNEQLNQLRLAAFAANPKVDLLNVGFQPLFLTDPLLFNNYLSTLGDLESIPLAHLLTNPNMGFGGLLFESSALPEGLTLQPLTGEIFGTPTAPIGDYPIQIGVSVSRQHPFVFDIEIRVRPSGHIGIGDMAIEDTFIIDDDASVPQTFDNRGTFEQDYLAQF